MKEILLFALVAICTSSIVFAQNKNNTNGSHSASHSMVGYLVDQNCSKRMIMDDVKKSDAKAAKHTRDCALDEACKLNGYGIVTDGMFFGFDEAGNKKAFDYLSAIKKENNIKVEVTGTMDGDHMNVESIKDYPLKGKKGR